MTDEQGVIHHALRAARREEQGVMNHAPTAYPHRWF